MRNKTWRWLILLLVLVLLAGGIWWIRRPPPPAPPDFSWKNVEKAGKLVIATDASYPPLANVGPDGQIAGFDIDVANELCRRLDLKPDFINTDLGGMVDGLVAKKYDVIISGWIPAEEHKKMLRYSYPYFDAGQVIVINTARGGPGSEEELRRGKPGGQAWKIAAEQGSTAEIMLRDWLKTPVPRGQPTPTPIVPAPYTLHLAMTPEEAIANVAAGTDDAAIVDHLTALQLTANHPELSVPGKPLTYEPYVVAARVADAELMNHINAALQAMIADGWLKQTQQRWLAQPPPP